jgi:hypothetical protein
MFKCFMCGIIGDAMWLERVRRKNGTVEWESICGHCLKLVIETEEALQEQE